MTIVCLGEAIVDLVCERELDAPGDADASSPTSAAPSPTSPSPLARAGAEAALLGGVGDDPWGRWLRARLEAEGGRLRLARHRSTASPRRSPSSPSTAEREPTFQVYGEGIADDDAAPAPSASRTRWREAGALVFGSNTLVGEPERG